MSVARSAGLALLLAGVAASALAQAPAPPAAPPPAKPAFEAKAIVLEPVHALVLPMKGAYAQHPDAFGKLGAFLAAKGAAPLGPPFGRYFSDPSVPEADRVWEVGFPVAAGVTAEAPFEIKDVPRALTAVHLHRGPMEDLVTAWPEFIQWIIASGYQPVGPAAQVFKGDLMTAPEVEMQLPVK
jgi:effector-binding domain-containing protein